MPKPETKVQVNPAELVELQALTVLNDIETLTSVGMAMLKMLTALLPVTAGKVEDASRNLTSQFKTLVENVHAQDNLIQALIEQIENANIKGTKSFIHATRRESSTLSKDIAHAVASIVVGMQFQDRNTQVIENAVTVLEQYARMLADLQRKVTTAIKEGHNSENKETAHAADAIIASIRIHDIRKHFLEALEEHKVPYSQKFAQEPEQVNQNTVELF